MPPEDTNATDTTTPTKPTDEVARLLKEAMTLKNQVKEQNARLEAFKGIDADKINELVARSEQATAAAREAENDRLLAAGEYDAWKARIVADHKANIAAMEQKIADVTASEERTHALISDLTIGNAFANNNFIADQTVLTSSKARKLYGDHFDVEDGKVVPYDAPRGSSSRSPLLDGNGQSLSFDQALVALVHADPERDALLKSSRLAREGNAARTATAQKYVAAGVSRIAAAVSEGALPLTSSHLDNAAARSQEAKPDASKVTAYGDKATNRIAGNLGALFPSKAA